MKRVIVHIDSLVLKGFRHEDRHALAEGLSAELGRLLAAPNASHHLGAQDGVSRLKIGAVHIGQGAKPAAVGVQAAQGIARGIKP
jgi:hypothetical protein